MKRNIFLVSIILFSMASTLASQNVRPPRDEIGFCWNAEEMNLFIDYLQTNYGEGSNHPGENLIAGIVPHDDFLYSGRISFPLFKVINTKEVVIFGVTHGTVRRAIEDPQNILILDNFDQWYGPYGKIETSPLREEIKAKLAKDYFVVNDEAQKLEHSIESLLPYLQHFNPDIKITPIMITKTPLDKMDEISDQLSKIITEYIISNNLKIGKDIFFLFSNDANHYGDDFKNAPYGADAEAHKQATDNDKRIAKECFGGEIDKNKIVKFTEELWPELRKSKHPPLWCGRYPITFGLLTTTKVVKGLELGDFSGKIFGYSDTFTEQVLPVKGTSMGITAPFSLKHWVGFLSVGFYLK